jgi:Cys-tRNA(Pro) deacylase
VPSTPVTRALDEAQVPYTLHLHDHPIASLEQAARERGLRPAQVVRSLVFRGEDGTFLMVLAPGPGKVSWPRLRRYLGVTRLTTASPEEVERVTGYPPGAVSPLGLPTPLRILADRSLVEEQVVSIGAGVRHAGVVLDSGDLVRLIQPELGAFLEPASADS